VTPIYVVSGLFRSGTSMMMRCLEAGGLPVVAEHDPENFNALYGDAEYKPNPNGFYQFDLARLADHDFPDAYRGKLIKVLYPAVETLPDGDYKVAFLLRDPAEIRASVRRFLGADYPDFEALPGHRTLQDYDAQMRRCVDALRARAGVSLTVLRYADVVAGPAAAFAALVEAGWPVDPAAAAAMVEPALYRFRL
jgi:hypothetical protein